MNKFPKRKSIRLKEYDYSTIGYYYATICTYNREESFGYIENNCVVLNGIGEIVKNTWLGIPNHFSNVKLDDYVIMPNHIHGIIIIVGDGHARPVDKNNNLSVIIGSFKSAVTKQINRSNNIPFRWQRFFYDHVIRIDKSLDNIREYIISNPVRWNDDENNIKNYKLSGQACLTPTKERNRKIFQS